MEEWDFLVKRVIAPKDEVTIGFVGKYVELKESYKSLIEALTHAGAHLNTRVNISWIDSEEIENRADNRLLENLNGILVAGGFGHRGVEGKIKAIQYAREHKIPYLGICLGMQLCLIEFARNVLKLEDANSHEFDKECKNPVIYLIDEFIDASGKKQIRTHKSPLGGTMRLGEYECNTKKGSLLRKIYDDQERVYERHRHRYEANPAYKEIFEKNGMIVSGESNSLIEAVELKKHPWFIGVQFHPEFTSRLQNPNKVIKGFIDASLKHKN
jgi:CTP synthase